MSAGQSGAGLSTHVLDTARGRPAAGVALQLHAVEEGGQRRLLNSAVTNSDGRTESPLIERGTLTVGTYELSFHVAAYFEGLAGVSNPPFLDVVTLRFTVADTAAHYHIPLLVSPWSYSTYRGS
ncbi:hydroxyisourate hydrolase [Deinococcus oregonensis]|uniref:5-hydroxyisourate hydrolase n=1 Tax=Deinococcus oregonensis TaxID=1805970 RepID=A0ABV6B3R1_9DEIO